MAESSEKIIYDIPANAVTLNTFSHSMSGTIKSIASKSCAHRLLIASAFADAETDITCYETSADIEATVSCLNNMGATITKENGVFHVVPIDRTNADTNAFSIDANESGSTLRFLLPVVGVLGHGATIMSHGRLPERPLSPLYEEMLSHGVTLSEQGKAPLVCSGKMTGGVYNIAGNVSSQYITGLLFALPMCEENSEIHILGNLESRPYVNITLQVLRDFGLNIEEINAATNPSALGENETVIFKVPGNSIYKTRRKYTVEGDWSNAAFFLSAGALSKEGITTRDLNLNSLQGDMAVLTILGRFGAEINYIPNDNLLIDINVKNAPLKGIEIDAANIPDLVPILAAVASVAEGKTVIRNIERLRIKESDRVKTVIDTLSSLGANICENNNTIEIIGKPSLTGGTIDSVNDHRIAMMAGVISAKCEGPVTITGANAVRKSYPEFYNDFISLMN